jgi:cell wall-associated NlpC family hydrolase
VQGERHLVLNGRKRLITLVSGFALVAAVGFLPSTPANAEPDIDDVQARVDRLYREAEQASERYNDAKLELSSLKRDLGLLKADQGRQDDRLEKVRTQVQDSIIRQYEGQSLSAMGQVVLADDPQKFLSQLSTMSSYNDMQDQLFDDYATELKSLDIRSDATSRRAEQVAEIEKDLGAEKATVDKKLAEAKTLLGELQAEQREQLASRDTVRTPTTNVPASGRASAAIAYAMAQVGKAYVYGAAGPDAFDCSGLTMMAWAQAGVALPHSSSAQYSSGPHVAESDLQPGDLVFYYSPISHVGMYIGNGMIVNAENPSSGIRVTSLHAMPYVGAVRPG